MGYIVNHHLIVHQLCEFLGYIVGGYIYRQQKNNAVIPTDSSNITQLLLLLGLVTGALWGSKLLVILNYFTALKMQPFYVWIQGKTIVGGLLGGLIGVEISKKILKVTYSTGDRFVYPLIAAMIIGRIGCLQAGIEDYTFGIPTSLPWGMNLGDGILRHPTSAYEIIFLLALFIVFKFIKFKTSGLKFKFFLISYLLFRFVIDFLKPPHGPDIAIRGILPATNYLGLSAIQIACLVGIFYYVCWFLYNRKFIDWRKL